MIPADINIWAILASAAAHMVLGFLWFSPWIFGKVWMRALGLTPEDCEKMRQKGMGKTYVLAFLSAFVTACVMALLIGALQVESLDFGLIVGALVWLGFVMTATSGSVIFEGRRPALYWISGGFSLVSLLAMSAILTLWP